MGADILILGGGPSGISTALHLVQRDARLAARILVLEKAHYPRPKLCGGGLTPDAEVILRRLGLDVGEIPHVDAAQAHLDFGGKGLAVSFRGSHALRMISRDEFDAWLAAKARLAGIQIREGVSVRRVVPHVESVTVETDSGMFEAAIVVGADGSNGVTRRCILPDAPIHTARALELLLPVANAAVDEARGLPSPTTPFRRTRGKGREPHAPNIAYFEFDPVPLGIAGYTWDFPTQLNGVPMRSWGIYDTNLLAARSRPPLKEVLVNELRRHGGSLTDVQIQGHPIRWFNVHSQLSVPRVLLVGDAAGTDGIFGEGISAALGYGLVAARAILKALSTNDFSFKDYRRRFFLSPLGQALILRTAITHVLYRLHWAWFQWLLWRLLKPFTAVVLAIVLNWARRMK